MTAEEITKMLQQVRRGKLRVPDALERLRHLPYEDLGYAKVDHHRALRQGFPEVIFARGKTLSQVEAVVRRMLTSRANILITRGDAALYERLRQVDARAEFFELSGAIVIRQDRKIRGKGKVLVVAAGTSDLPVAEEALTAEPVTARKSSAKAKQETLPLEGVSRGRFDRSEPTLYNGEDLDVPTYIRRGVNVKK